MSKIQISVVIPVYNEESNMEILWDNGAFYLVRFNRAVKDE